MSSPRHISSALGDAFAVVGDSKQLSLGKVRLCALLTINSAAAREGRLPPGGGKILLGVAASERAADTLMALLKSAPLGGPFVAMYSSVCDLVRVERLADVETRARAVLSGGQSDDESFPVAVGSRDHCENEATRLRRIRAGKRSCARSGGVE